MNKNADYFKSGESMLWFLQPVCRFLQAGLVSADDTASVRLRTPVRRPGHAKCHNWTWVEFFLSENRLDWAVDSWKPVAI